MRAKFIFEEFKEDSDPIEDLGIGFDWRLIEKGTQFPDDFVDENGIINHKNYIIERGFGYGHEWMNEYESEAFTIEHIGAIILGSKNYPPLRYRRRKSTDKPWDVTQSIRYKLLHKKVMPKK